MSMDHKAFVFDTAGFEQHLRPLLETALASGNLSGLHTFILENFASLTDPNEGTPLMDDWDAVLGSTDAQQLGDVALTRFYDPLQNLGLGPHWAALHDLLALRWPELAPAVLGSVIGPPENLFDPGKMGSYFQSASDAHAALERLTTLVRQQPTLQAELAELRGMLERAVDAHQGLYITF